jgi:hypothetical protein
MAASMSALQTVVCALWQRKSATRHGRRLVTRVMAHLFPTTGRLGGQVLSHLAQALTPSWSLVFHPVLLLCFLCGCSGAPAGIPQTFPVTGKVSQKNGQPFPGGMMEWRLLADPTLTVTALIKDDGTFEVFTLVKNQKVNGTVPGEFEVTIYPRIAPNQPAAPYRPARSFVVQEGENHFVIAVED